MFHGVPFGAKAWTICRDPDTDRPVYEADAIVCGHCGKTKFACDPVTKAPLPASSVYQHCPHCHNLLCAKCHNAMRQNGAVCSTFIDKVDEQERRFAEMRARTG